jgi:hypothetical protein
MNTTPLIEASEDDREYDVSPNRCLWAALCLPTYGSLPYKITLNLNNEEVTKNDITIYGKSQSKRPYGELGSVEQSNCCCFVFVKSSLGNISPGCMCQKELVEEIVEELKNRQRSRGDTGQIVRAEETLVKLKGLEEKVDLILNGGTLGNLTRLEEKIDLILNDRGISASNTIDRA